MAGSMELRFTEANTTKGTVFYYDPSTAGFKKFIRSPVVVQMEATLMKMFGITLCSTKPR